MRKYPSLKNCYKYLLKSAIQKLARQVHHCKSQREGESPKQNIYKQKEKVKKLKINVLKSGPHQLKKRESKAGIL